MIRRFLAAALLLAALAWPQAAHATWTLVQHVSKTCSAANVTSCAATVTSTGSGHLLVVTSLIFDGTTTVSSITGGGTYTHCTACVATDGSRSTDAYYTLNSSSGATTITSNWSASTQGDIDVAEYSSTTTFSFDAANTRTGSGLGGVALTLTGSNDVIVQGIVTSDSVSAITSPYTSFADFPDGNGVAGAANTASGTAPTWTGTNTSGALFAIAIKEGAAPAGCAVLTRSLLGVGC